MEEEVTAEEVVDTEDDMLERVMDTGDKDFTPTPPPNKYSDSSTYIIPNKMVVGRDKMKAQWGSRGGVGGRIRKI